MQTTLIYASPLGQLMVTSDGASLTQVDLMTGHNAAKPSQKKDKLPKILEQARDWFDSYFAGEVPPPPPSLAPVGTAFRQEVWEILRAIPYGQITTYGEIARQIEKKKKLERMSAQAVGGAVGHNPLLILIPCHRVVGANGNLTGFASGMDVKVKLLSLEKHDMNQFTMPKGKN